MALGTTARWRQTRRSALALWARNGSARASGAQREEERRRRLRGGGREKGEEETVKMMPSVENIYTMTFFI
jgi:hypothetical protein